MENRSRRSPGAFTTSPTTFPNREGRGRVSPRPLPHASKAIFSLGEARDRVELLDAAICCGARASTRSAANPTSSPASPTNLSQPLFASELMPSRPSAKVPIRKRARERVTGASRVAVTDSMPSGGIAHASSQGTRHRVRWPASLTSSAAHGPNGPSPTACRWRCRRWERSRPAAGHRSARKPALPSNRVQPGSSAAAPRISRPAVPRPAC